MTFRISECGFRDRASSIEYQAPLLRLNPRGVLFPAKRERGLGINKSMDESHERRGEGLSTASAEPPAHLYVLTLLQGGWLWVTSAEHLGKGRNEPLDCGMRISDVGLSKHPPSSIEYPASSILPLEEQPIVKQLHNACYFAHTLGQGVVSHVPGVSDEAGGSG